MTRHLETMTAVRFRSETPEDAAGIHALVAAAFGRVDEADLVDRLRADGDALISWVAVDAEANALIGHVMFSPMAAPFWALGMAPVSVRPDWQGRGIGSALIRAGLNLARNEGWAGVFVLGDPAYYGRFGFEAALAAGFASPYAGPHLMAQSLAGELPALAGEIAYAPAFSSL